MKIKSNKQSILKSIKNYFLTFGLLITFNSVAQTNVYDDIIAKSPDHTYLKAAIDQAGLQGALRNQSANLTVFAPTDAAFINLTTELNTTIAGILALPNLSDILTYHVLGITVPSDSIKNGQLVTPLNNANTLKLTKTSTGSVYINQAMVTTANISADNGLVHVLDGVVLPNKTVVDVALGDMTNFSTLVTAVIKAELLPALTNPFTKLTVFAPTNTAFNNALSSLGISANDLLNSPDLSDILTYHVLGTSVLSDSIKNGQLVTPLNNENTLKLTKASTGSVYVNQAMVTTANISADNGLVHVLDGVVLPNKTVVDVALGSINSFSTLVTAVIKAELLPALTNPFTKLTVFAPTNTAFNNALSSLGISANDLLNSPDLSDILTYHVLGTSVLSDSIKNGQLVTPLNNANTLKLTKTTNGSVYVNQAMVTTANISADNGLVHVLDGVVLPNKTVVDVALGSINSFSTLVTAVIKAELLPALTNPYSKLTVFAPTNAGFNALYAGLDIDSTELMNLPELKEILLYHVLNSSVLSDSIKNGQIVTPINDENTLKLTKTKNNIVYVNQAMVMLANLSADNGLVHVLDGVLLPVETVVDVALSNMNNFSTLVNAVVKTELLSTLSNPFKLYTVFAPTNTAFNNLASSLNTNIDGILALPNLEDVLLYHVLEGEVLSNELTNGDALTLNGKNVRVSLSPSVKINDADVTTADLGSDNGVVHIINKVLVPNTSNVSKTEFGSVNLYPNPSQNTININGFNNENFEIVNIYGSVVLKGNVSNGVIDINELPAGNYQIKIINNNTMMIGNFVKI